MILVAMRSGRSASVTAGAERDCRTHVSKSSQSRSWTYLPGGKGWGEERRAPETT